MTRSHQSEPAHGAGRRGLEGAASGNTALATKERRHCPIWLTNIENGRRKKKESKRRDQVWRSGGDGGLSDICIFKLGTRLWRNVIIRALRCLQLWHELIGAAIENYF